MIFKNSIRIGLLSLLLCIGVIGCKKDFNNGTANSIPAEAPTFKQLKVGASFNWENEKSVTLHVAPFSTPVTISHTIKVYYKTEEALFFAAKIDMDKPFSSTFRLPANIDSVTVSYGSIVKTIPATNNTLHFDFLSEL